MGVRGAQKFRLLKILMFCSNFDTFGVRILELESESKNNKKLESESKSHFKWTNAILSIDFQPLNGKSMKRRSFNVHCVAILKTSIPPSLDTHPHPHNQRPFCSFSFDFQCYFGT